MADVDGDEISGDTVGVNSNGGCVKGAEGISGEGWFKMDGYVAVGDTGVGGTSGREWGFWRRGLGWLEVFKC